MIFRHGKRKSGDDDGPSLPITALIDCVFLLLVYFLITSRLTPPESQLPSSLASERRSAAGASSLQPQVLRLISEGGRVTFVLGDRRLATQATLTNILSQLPKENGLFVRVPDDVPVEGAASALQAARDAGFTRISYVPLSQ
jgi:biopolymer transport protein ExbD